MIFSIPNLLTADELQHIASTLSETDFIEGKTTAGWHAKPVKNNAQLSQKADYGQELKQLVTNALKHNPLFQIAVRPKAIHSMLLSRYETGMSYGRHTDNALMGGEVFWRSDVSLTVFLNDPSHYEGGELIIEGTDREQSFKLAAGSAIIYPSLYLHRVEPVTRGVRLVAVAWVQSLIRDPHEREILFELDTARRSMFEKQGKTPEFDLISKAQANLLRKWAEV